MKKIQNHFISGILIVAPLALSIYVAWVVVGIADKIFRPFIPLNRFGIPSEIPGVGLIVAFLFFTILHLVLVYGEVPKNIKEINYYRS